MPQKQQTDIAIIGGGLVGNALAHALMPAINKGLSVTICESSNPTQDIVTYSPAFDNRTTALSAASVNLLKHWEIWPHIQTHAATVDSIEVSEKGGWHQIQLQSPRQSSLGQIVPNQVLGQGLLSGLKNSKVQYRYNTSINSLSFTADHIDLTTSAGTLNAKLVVLADGGRSDLKRSLGIADHKLDFHQQAIITNVRTGKNHGNVAFERFTEMGPMALLPMFEPNLSALVWSVPADSANKLLAIDDIAFIDQAERYFGLRLGVWKSATPRTAYPLIRTLALEQVRSRLVLIGNSALTLHPVAGQGFNLALRSIDLLAGTVMGKSDPGDLGPLSNYQDLIQPDQQKIMHFCDRLVTGFASKGTRIPRALGMHMLDHHRYTKAEFVAYAMGLSQANY